MDNKPYTNEEYKRDMKEILWQNRLQTIFLVIGFFWGVQTLSDVIKKK